KARSITLLPIGGVAQMEKIPEKPMQELLMAVAGPLVNIVIASILGIFLALSMRTIHFNEILSAQHITLPDFVATLMVVNVVLALFNFIPAFPMDGGRVLRALLSFAMNRVKATRIAARTGQVLAIGFVLFGLFFNVWMVFIGLFIFLGAGAEAGFEEEKSILETHKVKDAIMHKFTVLKKEDTIPMAVKYLLDSQETDFIVVENGHQCGIITRKEIIKGLSEEGKNSFVGNYMLIKNFILDPEMNLKEAYTKMTTDNIPICAVEESGKITGVLNLENIVELLLVEKAGYVS
ncbi:MAG TPA: site-2 protease family protein, partial [Bacteroidia bacterium]|nr:site-2 protease family protein [Bacteroidia bacterium]